MVTPLQRLSQVLWRQRELLRSLGHAREVEQVFVASGWTGGLPLAATDVESVQRELRRTEVLRAVAADEAASAVGLAPNPSLKELAARVDEPWREILVEHRAALASDARVRQPSLLEFLRP